MSLIFIHETASFWNLVNSVLKEFPSIAYKKFRNFSERLTLVDRSRDLYACCRRLLTAIINLANVRAVYESVFRTKIVLAVLLHSALQRALVVHTICCSSELLGGVTRATVAFLVCSLPAGCHGNLPVLNSLTASVATNQHFRPCRKNYALDRKMIDTF